MPSLCAIVGSGEGLGAALAARFAMEGCDIALMSRTEAGSAAAKDAVLAARPECNVAYYAADASDPQGLQDTLVSVQRDMGPINILIYNVRVAFEQIDPLAMAFEDLQAVFNQEVVGAFAAAKAVLPGMRDRGEGTIFFSSATAAFRGSAKYPLYSIGKFGLRGLSQSLTKAYAKDGVHIVHVRLDCDLDTPIMKEIYGDAYDPSLLANTADVAQAYWLAHLQPRSAWTNELELRPFTENWTI